MRRLEFSQFVPSTMPKVWDFFSSANNLAKITPPSMGFIITSPLPKSMYEGMLIQYKVKPLFGISLNWVTEITQFNTNTYFVDEQRVGPYKIWHHEHHFREVENGIEIKDILYYKVPYGFLGNIFDSFFVKQKVNAIFEYRKHKIIELFPLK